MHQWNSLKCKNETHLKIHKVDYPQKQLSEVS